MTIKDIETRSGMTRENICFYEAEGLLSPERLPDGYREYSNDDLEILKRIKLLRTLRIPLEKIKALQTGEQELIAALDQHLAKLELEKTDVEQSQEICQAMRSDGVRYQTLDAQHYLDAMEQITRRPVPVPASDAVPKVRSPWRRFFARSLDGFIYSALWAIFLSLAFNVNMGARSTGETLLDGIVAILLMILIEPALLALFGTTAGKWLLGLGVTGNDDRRLTYAQALPRTGTMMWRGMGLNLPIYSLVRQWKSYNACDAGETLDWEYDSTVTLKDRKAWRGVAYTGAFAAVFFVLILSLFAAEMPKNRGDITVAEFSENYNRLSDYYGIDTSVRLSPEGAWVEEEKDGYTFRFAEYEEPRYTFSETDGHMTGMKFSTELHGSDAFAPSYQNEMILSVLSFVRAQKGSGLFSNEGKDIVKAISDASFEDFSVSAYGVQITCEVEYSGYMGTGSMGFLWPEEDAETNYSFSFSMQKQ